MGNCEKTLFDSWIAEGDNTSYARTEMEFVKKLQDCGHKEMADDYATCIYAAQQAAYDAGFQAARELYK